MNATKSKVHAFGSLVNPIDAKKPLSLYFWQSATSLQGYLLAYQSHSADAKVGLHLCFSHAAESVLQAMLINPTRLANMPTTFAIFTNEPRHVISNNVAF